MFEWLLGTENRKWGSVHSEKGQAGVLIKDIKNRDKKNRGFTGGYSGKLTEQNWLYFAD